MIDRLVDHLKQEEGWVPFPYRDHLGFLTIGYGFLIDPRKPGLKMPREVGDLWLSILVRERYEELVRRQPWIAEQPEEVQLALGNMAYQIGVNGLLKFQRTLGALQAGNRKLAARHALESAWAEQTPARAQRVAKLIAGD